MQRIFLIASSFFLLLGSVSAQTCEDITSLGLGTLNSSWGQVGIIAYHSPLEGYRDGMNVELFDPSGDEIWFWETSGELGYMQNNPLVPAGGSGIYTFNAAVDDISVSCEAMIDVAETLGLVAEVETEFVGNDLQVTWSPVPGAEEYKVSSGNSDRYSVDIGEDKVIATLKNFESSTDSIELQISAFSKPLSYIDVETGEEYVTPGIYELNGSISELEVNLE